MTQTKTAAGQNSAAPSNTEEWQRLRALLLGDEQASLRALAEKVGDRTKLTRSVATVLAEAIAIRGGQDDRLMRVLAPLINEGLQQSVRKDPQSLVDALYPIIGPAIRRSVAEVLADMMQSFNRAVEQSFSPRAVKWRVDAWRTGQSYASIVLLNTLVYRVEQVFLIHRETGLLLSHVRSEHAAVQDPDMVSGMLTAIRDFAGDSFKVSHEDSVDSIRLGDLSVQVRAGPKAVLAAVVRGNAPESLREQLSETLERIHRSHALSLARFDGNTKSFAQVGRELNTCLTAQTHVNSGTPWRGYLMLVLIASLLGWWMLVRHQSALAWNAIVQELGGEPGLAVIESHRGSPSMIRGLRDPLARDPDQIVGADRARRFAISWDWKPYLSLEPEMILARARRTLKPPRSVGLRVQGGTLVVSGAASEAWLHEARARALSIPGISAVDDSSISNNDRHVIDRARDSLAAATLYFDAASAALAATEQEKLDALVPLLVSIPDQVGVEPTRYVVEIIGRADAPGTTEFNLRLSLSRADAVRRYLLAQGVSAGLLSARGLGASDSSSTDIGNERRVNFALVSQPSATIVEAPR
jgi:OOP family OmpA-OmpF porin